MKIQWNLLFGIVFALIVAVFAVINVDSVTVNYLFGTGEWPLILVILISVLLGGLMIGSAGLIKIYSLQRKWKAAVKENESLQLRLQELEPVQTSEAEPVETITAPTK
ncbi:lipopolysaccharide assembly protein LapA domain-containing protein [Niallia taxi]|uniref:LapA family protein n=1 Tax=Niallia TaxID=2837506 RepID=UPI0030F830EE